MRRARFTCPVAPNWDLLLASRWRAAPAVTAKACKVVSGFTFGVEVAPGQHPKVMHADVPGGEPESEALKRLVAGMEQMVSGFFKNWMPFVLTTPIPRRQRRGHPGARSLDRRLQGRRRGVAVMDLGFGTCQAQHR